MMATRLDNVGQAAVLRETSTVFAALIGWLVLKESTGPRRVILMSAHPSVLSDCAHALNSLLYPFQWEHIYVPILVPKVREPRQLLCYVWNSSLHGSVCVPSLPWGQPSHGQGKYTP